MKQSSQFTSALIVALGTALIALSSARFTAALPGDIIMGAGASLAIVGLAIHDYSRRVQPLSLPSRVLRPALPSTSAPRATAYGIKSARKDRIAA